MRWRQQAAALLAGLCAFHTTQRTSSHEDVALPACVGYLLAARVAEQLACLRELKSADIASPQVVETLAQLLRRSDGATDDALIASTLDVLRGFGGRASTVGETLSALLPHRAAIFRNRDKVIVTRLRARVLVTLTAVGFPSSAMPVLFDVLAHGDERMQPLEVGAAARAAGSLGTRGHELAPFLVQVVPLRVSEEEFSLERYEPRFPPEEATTIQLEAVRALGRVAVPPDKEATALLRRIASPTQVPKTDPRVVSEARQAIALIESRSPRQASVPAADNATEWLPAAGRTRLRNIDIAFKDHDGRSANLRELLDQPAVVTFFYTRCQNASKCSMTVTQLAFLQKRLADMGIDEKVRIVAISYEPQFDTPERINRFATDRGLRLSRQAVMVELGGTRQQQLVDELQTPVGYNAGWVNTHGVELCVLDSRARVARKYTTTLWDNERVADDLRRLLVER